MNPSAEPGNKTPSYRENSPPIRFGLRRAYYQYSTSIPQSHLVLVSVLEGIVFGVLLYNNGVVVAAPPNPLTFEYLLRVFLAIAPFIATSLIILLTWTDFVYASTVLIWPPTIQQTALIYLTSVPQIVAAREIADFPVWVVACSFVTLSAALVRFNNLIIFRPYDFEDEQLGADLLRREFYYGWLYSFFGILGLLLISLYGTFRGVFVSSGAFGNFANVDEVLHGVGYLLVLAIEVLLIILVSRYQAYFMNRVTKDTDLEVTRFGGLRHRKSTQEQGRNSGM